MKKVLALLIVILTVSMTTIVLARNNSERNLPEIRETERNAFKTMLKTYFRPNIHGYGIGFSDDKYVIAKWNIVSVKILPKNIIKEVLSNTNATDWSEIKDEIEDAIKTNGTILEKGRIRIGKTDYTLTNITISNSTAYADIRLMPDYNECKQSNTTAEDCENNSTKIGYLSLTKKTNVIEDVEENTRVWTGTLNFNSTNYTFVTFAYPRSIE